ncbi:MAG: transcriptional repressor LexA [Gammaproteobacteria bacterium]
MSNLTKRQAEILDFIYEFAAEEGYPPTRAEIAQAFGFKSLNAAEEHLRALDRKGAIELLPGSSRGIRLLEEEVEGIPLVGRVAAGNPVLAEENIEDYLPVDPAMFHPRAHYLLRVAGMSMKDIGIMDGDLLAVHRTSRAENGQIVVARIEDEVTVKRFRQRGSIVRLLPENEDFEPIVVDLKSQEMAIEGLGVGLLRNGALT